MRASLPFVYESGSTARLRKFAHRAVDFEIPELGAEDARIAATWRFSYARRTLHRSYLRWDGGFYRKTVTAFSEYGVSVDNMPTVFQLPEIHIGQKLNELFGTLDGAHKAALDRLYTRPDISRSPLAADDRWARSERFEREWAERVAGSLVVFEGEIWNRCSEPKVRVVLEAGVAVGAMMEDGNAEWLPSASRNSDRHFGRDHGGSPVDFFYLPLPMIVDGFPGGSALPVPLEEGSDLLDIGTVTILDPCFRFDGYDNALRRTLQMAEREFAPVVGGMDAATARAWAAARQLLIDHGDERLPLDESVGRLRVFLDALSHVSDNGLVAVVEQIEQSMATRLSPHGPSPMVPRPRP